MVFAENDLLNKAVPEDTKNKLFYTADTPL